MKTLTLQNIKPTDLELFVSLAKRLKIKAIVTETADENEQLTDCMNVQTGKPMTLKELRMEIAKGFEGEPEDFDVEEIKRMGREMLKNKSKR